MRLLDPDNPTAREWLRSELGKSTYTEHTSVWERFMRWTSERLHGLLDGVQAGGSPVPPIVTGVVLAVLAAVALWSLQYVRRDTKGRARRGSVLGDEVLTATQFRDRARAALARGDHASATLDAMRYLAQSSAERTLLEDTPSLTAHEIAVLLASPFPEDADRVSAAAALFDQTAYGGRTPSRHEAQGLLDLADRLRTTRPATLTPVGAPAAAPAIEEDDASAFRGAARGVGR